MGGLLLVLFVIDLVVTANLDKLIMIHIFIGALLAGPLLVKLFSVGYRFFRYYGKSPAFRAKGTPNIWLRLLAPVLIVLTLLLFVSGIGLAIEGDIRILFLIHAASAALWIPLLAVHVYAHIRQVPRAVREDWGHASSVWVSGRAKRLRIAILSLATGAILGGVVTSIAAPWRHLPLAHGIPTPLALGLVLAVFALIVAIPILRRARE